MAACNRWRSVGLRGGAGGVGAPRLVPLATTLLWWAAGLAWVMSSVVFYPGKMCRWASLFISLAHFYITLLELRLLLGFPFVFGCVSCKTCFLQYKCNYVNSTCICVKSMFISPILDYNWRSNLSLVTSNNWAMQKLFIKKEN